jgi:hypothetical protein
MRAANILHLGVKELRSLMRDPMMVVLIAYAFTYGVYTAATAMPETLNKAPIAIVDEDRSALSRTHRRRLLSAAVHPARTDHAGRDGSSHGRRAGHFRTRHPAIACSATCSPGASRRSSSTSMPHA